MFDISLNARLVVGNSSLDFDFTFDELMAKGLPNKELYMRWLQLATFLPVIRYSTLPSEYKDDDQVLELAKVLTALRQKMVSANKPDL